MKRYITLFIVLILTVQCGSLSSTSGGSALNSSTIYNVSNDNDEILSFNVGDETENYSASLTTDVYSLHVDDDAIWVGTVDGEVIAYDKSDGDTVIDIFSGSGLTTPVHIDSDSTSVWVADDDGNSGEPRLFRLNKESGNIDSFDLGTGSDSYDALKVTSEGVYVLIANDYQIDWIQTDDTVVSIPLGAHSDTTSVAELTSLYGYGSMAFDFVDDELWVWNDYVAKLIKIDLASFEATDLISLDSELVNSNHLVGFSDDALFFFDQSANLIYKLSTFDFTIEDTYTPPNDSFGDSEDMDEVVLKNDILIINVDDVAGSVVFLDSSDFTEIERVEGVYADVFDVEIAD